MDPAPCARPPGRAVRRALRVDVVGAVARPITTPSRVTSSTPRLGGSQLGLQRLPLCSGSHRNSRSPGLYPEKSRRIPDSPGRRCRCRCPCFGADLLAGAPSRCLPRRCRSSWGPPGLRAGHEQDNAPPAERAQGERCGCVFRMHLRGWLSLVFRLRLISSDLSDGSVSSRRLR